MLRIRTVAIAAIAAVGLALAGCGSSANPLDTSAETGPTETGSTAPAATDTTTVATSSMTQESTTTTAPAEPIVIGSANFTESELVAQIYAAALTAKGVDATTQLDIGAREVYLQAMEEGSVTLFPEYTGGLLAYYDKTSTAHSADDVYAALKKALPTDLTVLQYSPAQDQDSVTVTKETADKYKLESIADLAPVAGDMTLGGSSEWQTRADGPEGMKKLYGVQFKDYKVLDPGGPLSVKGLQTGLVQATDIFTTDPAIEANGFVVLKDPKNLFLAQNIVPLIAAKAATPTVTDTLDAVSAKLTTEGLTEMLKEIGDTKADPADVAQKWVADTGLS
jgi:osmoprotectant transport system substrate-binding protein